MSIARVICPGCGTTLSIPNNSPSSLRCDNCRYVLRATNRQASSTPIPTSAPQMSRADEQAVVPAPSPSPSSAFRGENPGTPLGKEPHGPSRKPLIVGLLLGFTLVAAGAGCWYFFLYEKDDGKKPDRSAQGQSGDREGDGRSQDKPVNDRRAKDKDKPLVPVKQDGLSAEVLERVKKATVYIRVKSVDGSRATGSGFFGAGKGLVMTNAHVIGMLKPNAPPPESVEVILNSGLKEERVISASIVCVDRSTDLAVLRVEGKGPDTGWPKSLPVLPAAKLKETQDVIVIGYPFGETLGKNVTVSTSTVSSLRSDVDGLLDRVQVNGGMHPGNSGGPVIDADGNVIGVAVAGLPGTQINLAIPGEHVQRVLRGGLAGTTVGETVMVDGKPRVLMTVQTIDPLQCIKSVSIDWWIGGPGEPRPPSKPRPNLLPTDGPRTTTAGDYRKDKGEASVTLPLQAIPSTGSLLWYQAHFVDGEGTQHWGPALSQEIVAPTHSQPARLVAENRLGRSTLDITSQTEFRLPGKGSKNQVLRRKSGLYLLEDVRRIEKNGGRVLTYYTCTSRPVLDETLDGELQSPPPIRKALLDHVEKLALIHIAEGHGDPVHRTADGRNCPPTTQHFPVGTTQQLDDWMGNGGSARPSTLEVNTGFIWHTEKLFVMDFLDERSHVALIPFTCQFMGVRQHGSETVAVLKMKGDLRGIPGKPIPMQGKVSCEVLFDVNNKRIVRVQYRMDFTLTQRVEGETFQANGVMTWELKRGPLLPLPDGLPPIDSYEEWMVKKQPPAPPPPPSATAAKMVRRFSGHTARAAVMAFSPDGRLFASCGVGRETLCIWEVATGKLMQKVSEIGPFHCTSLMFSQDGALLLIGGVSTGRDAKVIKTADGSTVSTFKEHRMHIRACWLSADGATATTVGNDERIRVWDAQTGKALRTIEPKVGLLNKIVVTPDKRFALTAGRMLPVFDLQTGERTQTIDPPYGAVAAMPDNKHILCGHADGRVVLIELQTGKVAKASPEPRKDVEQLSTSADGKLALASCPDGVHLLDVEKLTTIAHMQVPGGYGAVVFSGDGRYMASSKANELDHTLWELPKR